MRTFIRGAAVEKAESYTLFELVNGDYASCDTATEINFEITELVKDREPGTYTFVVGADAVKDSEDRDKILYEESDYSDPITYTVPEEETVE